MILKGKKIFGLIGCPVSHSLSPLMHNAAFHALKINAEYKLFEIKPQDLDLFLDKLEINNIQGLNVTVPYKEKILDFVTFDSESSYLRQIKAVNTIVKKDNKWKGFNTDIPGFSRDLKEHFNPSGKRAAMLGAGGAARAVAYVLAKTGVKEIAIFDIDKSKSKNLTDTIKELFPNFNILSVDTIEQLDLKNKDLLVNATPVGLKESDPCLVKEEMLHKNLFCYDLIYNPAETKLLALAKKVGAKKVNGLGMLLYQGALSFEHFTGRTAPIDVMRQALEEGVKKI
jgi:shikimate dehydrogenase